ncbi:MAG TPA: hypothetical protein VFC36_04165, partial [Paludibacter sp.]|nr:hypothetical protein [Paludibacter sp.]
AHIFPKSLWPEYYVNPLNVVIMCRDCHQKFDDDRDFRAKQWVLIERAKSFAFSIDVYKHFD